MIEPGKHMNRICPSAKVEQEMSQVSPSVPFQRLYFADILPMLMLM